MIARQRSRGWPRLRLLYLPERPHLDAPHARRRDLGCHEDGFVKIPGVDEEEPTELLLRLGEGTVRVYTLPLRTRTVVAV